MRSICAYKFASLLLVIGFLPDRAQAQESFSLPGNVANILESHCFDCHGDGIAKGDVQLDGLTKLSKDARLALLNNVQEQLYLNQMPPRDKSQPSDQAKQELVTWIHSELAKAGQDLAFRERMASPKFANYVDHAKLFSGEYANLKGLTFDRDWLISEYIFQEKINALLERNGKSKIDGQDQMLRGARLDTKIVNPFSLPNGSGVRYYANEKINSSHASR